ncbi:MULTISPECIES: DUF2218 domain-containing protein [unclassified Sinorhizobium]|uniref:DUF2218 domain-containing protein n=1 Tax=unclassified Sinorhizobium TaxID=2613772 RepID=UPI0035268ABA
MMSELLYAWTRVSLSNADVVIAKLCAHMLEHNAEHKRDGDDSILSFNGSSARFSRQGNDTAVRVTAPSLEGLYFMRMAVASHILEFANERELAIEWKGDGIELSRPPNFTILKVGTVRDLTPRMRRITFLCDDARRFLSLDALHLNLLLPHQDVAEPQWPSVGADGLIKWENPQRRPVTRKYTVRSIDQAASTIDIDFVRHADAGPGSSFAERARPDDVIGALGPGGGGLVEADWYLLAGDETALPAIARMAEHLPSEARAVILIEVADRQEIQALSSSVRADIRWLCRREARSQPGALLTEAIRSVTFPSEGTRIYAWAACEFEAFRQIREYFRRNRKLSKAEHLVVSYWRRGKSEDQMIASD